MIRFLRKFGPIRIGLSFDVGNVLYCVVWQAPSACEFIPVGDLKFWALGLSMQSMPFVNCNFIGLL